MRQADDNDEIAPAFDGAFVERPNASRVEERDRAVNAFLGELLGDGAGAPVITVRGSAPDTPR